MENQQFKSMIQLSSIAHSCLTVVGFGSMSSLLSLLAVFYNLYRSHVYVWLISCFQRLCKVFSGNEMIIWSVSSLVRMILGFLTSKWLFESLRKSHPGFRSLVFSLSWQSHQAAPFKHCYSLRATFLNVLGANHLILEVQFMPLDSLLKCWDFNLTRSTSFPSSFLPFWRGEQLILPSIYLSSHISVIPSNDSQ